MEQNKSCITINCGCCGGSGTPTPTPGTGDGTPVGTILAYMGTKAPQHYLVCDGAVLNIGDYPQLSQQIQDEFGAVNYFGGDGLTTFGVPNLRNEFLRGYHGDADKKLSGATGLHQDATGHVNVWGATYIQIGNTSISQADGANNVDEYLIPGQGTGKGVAVSATKSAQYGNYASRPTNVAVLYCIKSE